MLISYQKQKISWLSVHRGSVGAHLGMGKENKNQLFFYQTLWRNEINLKKSCIWETLNLLTDADISTDIVVSANKRLGTDHVT